jgi:hypothetical protein
MSNNQAGIPGRGRQSKNQQAKTKIQEACAKKTNQPIRKSTSADCCPEIYPWNVHESGRSYVLNVTKEIDKKIMGSDTTRKGAAEAISKGQKEKQHEFYIVAPKLDKHNKVTYKKITVEHTFIKNKCNHIMIASNKMYKEEKEISENGSFEIDSNGHIKKAKQANCYNESSTDEFSDLEIVLKSIFNPKDVSQKIEIFPIGSSKCVLQPKVNIYVLPFTKYSATLRIAYTTEKKQAIDKRSIRTFDVTSPGWEVSFNAKGQYGTHILGGSIKKEWGKETAQRKYTKEEKEKARRLDKKIGRSESHLLGKIEKVMYMFTKADKENKKYFEKLKNKSSHEAQECAKHYPTFAFDPGTTGIMFGVTGFKNQENLNTYTADRVFNATLKLNILTGAEVKVDILSLLISRAGGKAKKLLSSIRIEACKGWHGVKGEIVVEMKLIGGGTLKFDLKKEMEKPLQVFGNGSVKLGVSAKASAKIEGKVWFVTIGGELSGVLASAINQSVPAGYEVTVGYFPEKDNGCWKAGFVGSGLALYYVLKGSISTKKEEDTDNMNDNDGFLDNIDVSGESSDHFTIFPADKPKDMDCIDMSKYLT